MFRSAGAARGGACSCVSAEGVFVRGRNPFSRRGESVAARASAAGVIKRRSRDRPARRGCFANWSRSACAVGRLMRHWPQRQAGMARHSPSAAAPFRCRAPAAAAGCAARFQQQPPGVGPAVGRRSSSRGGGGLRTRPGSRQSIRESGRRSTSAARRGPGKLLQVASKRRQRISPPAGCRHRPVDSEPLARTPPAKGESASSK